MYISNDESILKDEISFISCGAGLMLKDTSSYKSVHSAHLPRLGLGKVLSHSDDYCYANWMSTVKLSSQDLPSVKTAKEIAITSWC